jgi:transposase
MAKALAIRTELSPEALRRLARGAERPRTAARLYAIAHALEGMSRAEAARLAGMERQALRDAVVRYNAEGVAGLRDRPHRGPPVRLTPEQQAAVVAWVLEGPDPERDGISTWRLADIGASIAERYAVNYTSSALSKLMRRLRLSWQKARPSHPRGDPEARAAFKKTSPRRWRRSRPRTRTPISRSGSRMKRA